ncbi:MAG: hypothetical protein SGILL_001599 [Bacillariaceae sp.]
MAFFIKALICVSVYSERLYAFAPQQVRQRVESSSTMTTAVSSLQLFSSANGSLPSDDLSKESPEDRAERMKLVRQIQANFYRDDGEEAHLVTAAVDDASTDDSTRSPRDRLLTNVPLFRVQWTELPGYQNMLNIHESHYTHMFRRVLQQERSSSWRYLYGHIYLPDGSKNLNNPDYRYDNPDSKASRIGTLMQISDVMDVEEDGRLGLIVQATERFEIVNVTQHEPYAMATIRLLPEDEFSNNTPCALEEFETWCEWENYPTKYSECNVERGYPQVTPLVNYNGEFFSGEVAIGQSSTNTDDNDANGANMALTMETERKVWLAMDNLLTTIRQVSGMSVPIPSQLLILLPVDCHWPDNFCLEQYAKELQARNMQVGTYTKSPFLRVAENPSYPPLRRARRLSYAIWILLDNILGSSAPNRQSLLECETMTERLVSACDQLNDISTALREKQ